MTRPEILDTALTAARDADRETLHGLVDWTLTGAGRMSRALPGIDVDTRADAAAQGFAEMESVAPDGAAVRRLAATLTAATDVRPASAEERAAALDAIRVADPAPGLTAEQSAELNRLAALAAQVTDVWVAAIPGDAQLTLATGTDPDRLIVCGWPQANVRR